MEDKRIEAVKNWPEPSLSRFCQFLLTFHLFLLTFHQLLLMSHQFLSTFHSGLKQVNQTTYLDAQNNHNQISRELVNVRDMAEDAEVGSGTSSIIRSAKNSSASETWLRMLRLVAMVIVVIKKQSKDYLFPRSQTYLQGILPPYAPTLIAHLSQKDEFPVIVLAMIEARS